MKSRCMNCGRFPFCEEAEKNNCENWVKRVAIINQKKERKIDDN